MSQKKRKGSDQNALRKVPHKFKGLGEYLEVFESLLLEECRAQIQRGNEEEGMLLFFLMSFFEKFFSNWNTTGPIHVESCNFFRILGQ